MKFERPKTEVQLLLVKEGTVGRVAIRGNSLYYSWRLCAARDTTRSIYIIQIKLVQTERTIEIQLVRLTEACGKV